jgi:N-acetylmuramoyl-L-alanine amidase CwlA
MDVRKMLIPRTKYSIKSPYAMNPEFYVVHNTYNDASANNEIAYMTRNDKQVSYHYAIDDREVVQGIPENRNAWHAGDGGNGAGNRKGIAVEICYSKSGGPRFIAAEKRAAEFIANGLKEKGWGLDKVKKHQDFSGKYCPHRTLDMGWDRFLKMIESYMQKEPEGIKINIRGKLHYIDGVFQNDKNYVSVRELAEALGHTVTWDKASQTVVIR